MNTLYFADCLDVLKELDREHGGKGFIDLIYNDPPFNSKRNYNVLFESIDLKDATAQKQAFADTWSNYDYLDTLDEIGKLNRNLYEFLTALNKINISDSAVAYLTTMSIRIHYMHKLLKDTGSFYLHCDPTMSHYLKLVCDLIFGEKNFRNEIVWQRANAHNIKAKYFDRLHDVILFYSKSDNYLWNHQYTEYSVAQLSRYKEDETGRLFTGQDLTMSGVNPNRQFEWRGSKPPSNRSWGASLEQLEEWFTKGKILLKKDGTPRLDGLKVFLDELKGKSMGDIWIDVDRVGNTSSERLGYPTQKPEALLERIIKASTKPGDLVADFFCGCGTTIAASEKQKRKWIGADISHLAIRLIVKRLVKTYGEGIKHNIIVKGFPRDIASAHELAEQKGGRMDFQEWVIEYLINEGVLNQKKSADGGWDGYLTFEMPDKKEFVLIEVKSGNVNVKNLREFVHVVNTEKAAMGVFTCFEEQVTRDMRKLEKESGYFRREMFDKHYPKIQIITIEELLQNKQPRMPKSTRTTFKSAQRSKEEGKVSKGMFD